MFSGFIPEDFGSTFQLAQSISDFIKECGTSEALKLKLHINSEVYKGEIFNDFG